jgi:epoxyqueuosine reductase
MPTLISRPHADIVERALALGFDAIGFARPDAVTEAGDHLAAFVAGGRHGDMGWLADTLARRRDPQTLWPGVKSVVVVAVNYGPDSDPMATLTKPAAGTISVYARNRDYHDLLKGRLKQLAGWLHARHGGEVKVFVDTAPVLEKPLAQAAGIGWQGKHTNLVSREWGSWLFLGALFTELDLAEDAAEADHCGSCRACLDICPTGAFPAPYQLDARRCISYLTIEHKGHIDRDLRPLMGNRIYGCDDCLAVCPWNRFARATDEDKLRARGDLDAPLLAELAALDDAGFRHLFSGSPIKRVGRDRFVRNVLIAIGNSGEPALIETAEARLVDLAPLVRAMAVWALARLADRDRFDSLRERHFAAESDANVKTEWTERL